MKILFTIILAILTNISIGQSGYLGSKTNFQINMSNSLTPLALKGKQKKDLTYKETRINFNSSYAFIINRVINDKLQVGIGYRFAPMVMFSSSIWTDVQDPYNPNLYTETLAKITNKLKVNHHSGILNLRLFTNGISPIGKGIGIDFEYGRTSISQLDIEYTSGYQLLPSSNLTGFISDFLPFSIKPKKKYELNELENSVDSTTTLIGSSVVNSFVFKGYIGRTIPVSKKIGIDVSFTFPLLRVLNYDNRNRIGLLFIDNQKTLRESNVTEAIASSIAKYNSLSLNIGIKYFL